MCRRKSGREGKNIKEKDLYMSGIAHGSRRY